jgi:hypothetical protein
VGHYPASGSTFRAYIRYLRLLCLPRRRAISVSPFSSGHPLTRGDPQIVWYLQRLVPASLPHTMLVTGHLCIHGAASFASRHKIDLLLVRQCLRRPTFGKGTFGVLFQTLEPHILAHLRAILFRGPERWTNLSINGELHEIDWGLIARMSVLGEVN